MRILLAAVLLAAPAVPQQDPEATERLLKVVEKRLRENPDPTDPRAAAARLGFDRAKVADFVGGLAWEPYVGILREPGGTLMSGGGNSVDRALLLQAMLEAGGEKTRLMRVDVAEADGAKLVDAFRKRERKDRPESDPKTLAAELGADSAVLETIVSHRRSQEAALVDEIVDAGRTEAARLLPLAGAVAPRGAAIPKEHVWVQVFDKNAWVDVDPSPADISKKGGRPVTPQELVAQRRSLTLRLILHRQVGGKPEAVLLMSVPMDLPSVSWKVVEFLIQPLPGQLPAGSQMRVQDAKAVTAAFLGVKQYRAALIVDGKSHGGLPFDLEGRTYDVDAGGRVGPAKALSGGVGKAFGGLGGGFGGGDGVKAGSALESLVLELGVKEPGSEERVHGRTLVTAVKGGDRALPFVRYSYLIDGGPLPQGEWGRRELKAIAANANAMRKLIRGPLTGIHFRADAEISPALLMFGDFRRRALLRLADGAPFLQDRAGIVAETSQIFVNEETGRVSVRQGIDILDNPGVFDGAVDKTFALGAAETALECLLLARLVSGVSNRSAWTLLERGRLQGGKAEVIDKFGGRVIRWSADAYWSVDTVGGTCVGRVPSGAGQGLIETLIDSASQVCSYADAVGFLSGASGATGRQPEWADKTTKMFGRACSALGGTSVRDEIKDQIDEMTKNLWQASIGALSGL